MSDKTVTTELKIGDKVKVLGAADILTIMSIVKTPGHEDAAVFEEGGFWRLSQLRKVEQ